MDVKREGLFRRPAFWYSAATRDTLPTSSSSNSGHGFGVTDLDYCRYRRKYGQIEEVSLDEVKCGHSLPAKMQAKALEVLGQSVEKNEGVRFGGLNIIKVIIPPQCITDELRKARDDLAMAQIKVILLEDSLPKEFFWNEVPISNSDLVRRLSMGLQPQQNEFKLAEETRELMVKRLEDPSEEDLEEFIRKKLE